MQTLPLRADGISTWAPNIANDWLGRFSGLLGMCAMAGMITAAVGPKHDDEPVAKQAVASAATTWRNWLFDPTRAFGGYGGVSYTHRDTVRITKDDKEVSVRDFDWIGQPFKAPIYYGARVWRWGGLGSTGMMVDFTHAKAIANPESVAKFTGSHQGQALPASAPIKDVFSKLEFSHGHNMLTYNGLFRLGALLGRVRPYFGVGAGVSLPHTEIGYAKDNARTYEYQFAGFAGQGLAGLEIDLGRTSLFLEYKFSYAPHNVPVSHEANGTILPADLWRQLSAWWRNEKPPGGRLKVNLATHHGIAGVMVKSGSAGAAAQ